MSSFFINKLIFLFNSENISFYHCTVQYIYVYIYILLYSLFKPLLWTIRPCFLSQLRQTLDKLEGVERLSQHMMIHKLVYTVGCT